MNREQHMERAFKRLEVARLNLASGYPDDSCNRSYYATFKAASAALAVLGISPPRTHKGVAKLFQQHVPASCITFLSEQAFAPQNTRFWSRSRVWFQFTVGEDKPPMLSVDNRGKGVLSMDCSAKRSPL